jgi:endonuclease YncB( thermonuclease family)
MKTVPIIMTGRRNYRIALLMIFFFLSWSVFAFADFSGKVVAVKDGDTIEVVKEGVAVRVRLYGIDCPEKGQAFGQKAKQFVSGLAFGKTVKVIEKDLDRYRRTVGEVILEDGRSLNRELVRAGLAWWYRQYAKKDAELEKLESDARKAKVGLWFDADPVSPWDWRRGKRKPG